MKNEELKAEIRKLGWEPEMIFIDGGDEFSAERNGYNTPWRQSWEQVLSDIKEVSSKTISGPK